MVRRRMQQRLARTCVNGACEREVEPGKVACAEHMNTWQGRETQKAVDRMAGDLAHAADQMGSGRRSDAATVGAFRQRIERGDYGKLLEKPLRAVVRQAAAERTLAEEIGALRLAAKRVLMEEEDPGRMALGLSRVTTALARLVKQEQELAELRDRAGWEEAGQALTLRTLFAGREARDEERGTGDEEKAEGLGEAAAVAETDLETEEREARNGEQGERRTIRSVVEEWRAQGGEERAMRAQVDVGEDEIVDLFSEMRPGGWRYELADEA